MGGGGGGDTETSGKNPKGLYGVWLQVEKASKPRREAFHTLSDQLTNRPVFLLSGKSLPRPSRNRAAISQLCKWTKNAGSVQQGQSSRTTVQNSTAVVRPVDLQARRGPWGGIGGGEATGRQTRGVDNVASHRTAAAASRSAHHDTASRERRKNTTQT